MSTYYPPCSPSCSCIDCILRSAKSIRSVTATSAASSVVPSAGAALVGVPESTGSSRRRSSAASGGASGTPPTKEDA